ncbi:E3 ubiquitin-protein ligase MYCBP2 isoform X2 [Bacillus rossius redtenbacheri]|uniref:E3 ubiquitin-protein ligase MYCBP2 isoform X2 n=1 Tax=Bacillus rossius redtenbacheri TaxID=93214 RepID=UPI002FDE5E1C
MRAGAWDQTLPEPELLGRHFHEQFKISPSHQRGRSEWKKGKKGKPPKGKEKRRAKAEAGGDAGAPSGPPEVELPTNASSFAVFASVRLAVLERWTKQACQIYLSSSASAPAGAGSDQESDSDDNTDKRCDAALLRVPKIVGVGLRCGFELIRESRSAHPALCTKALRALLDVVQGQQPEGFKDEPAEVVDPLFDLLLDLATSHGPESAAADDGSHLTAVACACLLGLVAARGDTGKLLSAVAALLMCPRALATQSMHMPAVLTSVQRSVHGVLLGKMVRPDWITHGVPKSSRIDTFHVKIGSTTNNIHNATTMRSLASDGQYVYLFVSRGLYKIGSGYGGTIKGHVYLHKPDFYIDDKGWLGFANKTLFFKPISKKGSELLSVDRESFKVTEVVNVDGKDSGTSVMFSDSESLGMITSAKDDGFAVRMLNMGARPMACVAELALKLARKCISVFGTCSFDEEPAARTLRTGCDEETASVAAGKDFGLVRTSSGKVLYCGKAASLGIKQGGPRAGRWAELPLTKSPRITHVAVGHEGLHAALVAEDGAVFFAGTARRGEDGDQNKARRQPKPVKPKKMMKVEGQQVVYAACNNGTTALVTREGELLMFGKDTAHCDASTGQVTDLKEHHITQVALGKAHAVALTNKGHVFTFGINNKGQCGRDFASHAKEAAPAVVAMETAAEDDADDEEPDWEDAQDAMCPPGRHRWRHEMCMVCTVCRECTGYSISCLSSMRPDRNPGQECGCGEGDSGCSECGCCRICARENIDNSELAILGPSGAGDLAGMMRLDLIFGASQRAARFKDQLQRKLEERGKGRQRGVMAGVYKLAGLKARAGANSSSCAGPSGAGAGVQPLLPNKPAAFRPAPPLGPLATANLAAEDQAAGSDAERDASRVTSLPPARVHLPADSPVAQVACGLHHTVLLLQSGEVLTFGSNAHGQLGTGDLSPRGGPGAVRLPAPAGHVAAGGCHTVVLTVRGEVFTFGSYQKGQLGRPFQSTGQDAQAPGNSSSKKDGRSSSRDGPWYAVPGQVPGIGPKHGRRATWVGASGDQTFLKVDESLINAASLARSTVMANKTSIVLLPTQPDHACSFRCLAINRRDGSCNSFAGPEHVDFSHTVTCLDPLYNVLWSYHAASNEMACYNPVASEAQTSDSLQLSVLSPELALPVAPGCFVTRSQAALHLLCCLDTLTQAQEQRLVVREEGSARRAGCGKVYSREDFSAVTRFESHGGGWGYSGHSIEAIRFMADTDVLLGGFGLFGGRGEYTGKIKLFDIGMDGGEQETDGEVLAETDEIPYECGPRQKYPMLFDEPIPLQANRWYVAWARVSGPSSDCGSSGQGMVTTEDQVVFYFKSSKKSNNGTDVNAGQIPQVLYQVVTPENQAPSLQADLAEPVYILSRDFSRTVSRECFQSLLALLQWSWNTFKAGLVDMAHTSGSGSGHVAAVLDLERLVYISRASLRLLRSFTSEIYPDRVGSKKQSLESVCLAECVGDVRALLRQILSDPVPGSQLSRKHGKIRSQKSSHQYHKMTNSILEECHQTFVSCFHAFYPTSYLKWNCLCELLAVMDKTHYDHLLSAVLAALCSPTVRLRSTFPVPAAATPEAPDRGLRQELSPSDNSGVPMMPSADGHHYPILVEQMTYRSQCAQAEERSAAGHWQFRDVLERLLDLVAVPVRQALCREKASRSPALVRHCCHLLSRVVAELASQSSGTAEDVQAACGRILHSTPSRFTRTNQSRTWNTGNGSPDAICFSVDRPGVVVAGVCVYGGLGNYEYELELLDDQSNAGNDPSHAQRWNSLELARGSFGPDDCVADTAEVRFDRPVPVKEGAKYAVRLRNHGGRTSNGDGGLASVKGPDGTVFAFSTCSLSFNGTTQTRGQIPQILYYSNLQDSESQQPGRAWAELQGCRSTLSVASAVAQRCGDLLALARERAESALAAEVLGSACVVTTLLPFVFAHVSPLATLDPRSGVQVLGLIQELLPHVAALNSLAPPMHRSAGSSDSLPDHQAPCTTTTTSHHYAWVESDHPYKPATVSNYRVSFPEGVKWLCVEFDPRCGTAQAEDTLQLYVPSLPGAGGPSRPAPAAPAAPAAPGTPGDEGDADSVPVPYWPVLRKFSRGGANWPQNAIVLPGNEVIFSLETASDYVKDEKACYYGFRCLVVGYEWHTAPGDGLRHLEMELAFLGGMCAASLMKKELLLPLTSVEEMDEDVEIVEELAQQEYHNHAALLGKGFALGCPPTIAQALDGNLPFSCHSNERLFLKDLVQCAPGTSGGRLARWLQPDSHVEPARCEVLYSKDDMRCGWPAIVTVLTRDQYGDLVHVPNLKIEVKALPIDKKELGDSDQSRKMRRVSEPDALTFGGHAHPSLDIPYEVTIKDKMCYYAITIMKAYENYSFEELRLTSPAVKRSSENMLVRPNSDGTYSATWTPGSVGWYSVLVTVDGYDMEELHKVEVKEPPQGMMPPVQSVVKKPPHQPSRLRKFVAKNSAGLRVRAHPSLQSEQIGIVHVNGTIAFVDEIHNDDGVWLRLSQDTIQQYCGGGHGEAWCLQYNQHLGKTLLLPVEQPRSILDQVIKETILRKCPEIALRDGASRPAVVYGPGEYQVVKCGASGHNVRCHPSLKAAAVGMLVLGNRVTAVDYVVNTEGTWVQLDDETVRKFCMNGDGEAWSLALGHSDVVYLRKDGLSSDGEFSSEMQTQVAESIFPPPAKKGFDFSQNTNLSPFGAGEGSPSPFNFSSSSASRRDTPLPDTAESGGSTNPFVFGFFEQPAKVATPSGAAKFGAAEGSPRTQREREREREKECRKFTALQTWLKGEEGRSGRRGSPGKDLPPELAGVSVKELVKAIGESRANGNGVTPPGTPRRLSRSSSPKAGPGGACSPRISRSSSPVPIPGGRPAVSLLQHDSGSSSSLACVGGGGAGSSRSIGLSPLVSGAVPDSQRRGSTQSDTSALVSSLTHDLSQSPTTANNTRDLSPSPSCSSLQLRSEGSAHSTPGEQAADYSPRTVTQTGTQTSPESAAAGIKGHFSIGAGGAREERLSPVPARKARSKRAMSPAAGGSGPRARGPGPGTAPPLGKEPVKPAVSPSVAESLRAVFAAFLWHEGVVHDAMACASFLKFHPGLPKQGALVVTRPHGPQDPGEASSREQRARQRHSVEVSTAGTYLHIQPATLETLTRSAATASASRSRARKQHSEGVISEEAALPETVAVLPPALRSLVVLWEELSRSCLQAIAQHSVLLPSPTVSARSARRPAKPSPPEPREPRPDKRPGHKKKEWKPMGQVAPGPSGAVERETPCELCGNTYPQPVTYHMRQAHPGCGGHAGGKGYNSGGNFCVGWAGNCGDGGVGGSSWYLVCDACRAKYLRCRAHGKDKAGGAGRGGGSSSSRRKAGPALSPACSSRLQSPSAGGAARETHVVMRNNAMFLLELASASGSGLPPTPPRGAAMPPVSEHRSPPEAAGPFSPVGAFRCLQALGAFPSQQARDDRDFLEEAFRRENGGSRPVSDTLSDNESESSKGKAFHRSISMGTNGVPWSRRDGEGRYIMMRKRNNSSSEVASDGGSSLLCYPSAALQKLVPGTGQSAIVSAPPEAPPSLGLLDRPVMLFVLQHHNLGYLQLAMRQALRKAACRVYAMQALNWLLRSVTQPVCLHDLLWWFVAALTPAPPEPEAEGEEDHRPEPRDDSDCRGVCEHPLSDIGVAGEAAHPLPQAFHALLQTVADLMVLLPMGSALQQAAVRCWGLRFSPADHMFLHRSQVFSNISKILSRSEEEQDDAGGSMHESHQSSQSLVTSCVETLKDLTPSVEIKASSRQAMVGSLVDSSTETFWESGDEDRNKTKTITILCAPQSYPRMVYIHIDNCRDLANKVSSVTFQSGPNIDELYRLRQVEVENRSTGWVSCPVLDTRHAAVRLELKGPDNSLRLRQIRVLGEVEGESTRLGRQHGSATVQHRNCEAETLRVFRLITSQVFGKLIVGEQPAEAGGAGGEGEETDLKEHMVGILFSRSKLTHLQKQVCVHIVQAIRAEAARVREEWEALLCSGQAGGAAGGGPEAAGGKRADAYCFEMLSMVLALSGSGVGRAYLAHQAGLLRDLLSLLHTGSARVHRQVTSLLRRMLPEISPAVLSSVMSVDRLPPADFSIVSATNKAPSELEKPFDIHSVGVLDVFLACIAKALTVQVKAKGKDGKGLTTVTLATSIHPRDYCGARWWLRGCIARRLAEDVMQLLKDMAAGKLSEAWADVTKGAVAESILNLTRLDEPRRCPPDCLRTPTLWLALASLCVLDREHVEHLSSGQWSGLAAADGQPPPPRPTCSNHDDGETAAIIQCSSCGNLCADCDRFLHLHRRTRLHQRQVCKEEEEAIKVDLHEGCGRTKLFWVMALADSRTLKAMVEFREGARSKPAGVSPGVCRFCGATGSSGLLAIGNICADQECQEHARHACSKLLPCGHVCGGIKGESPCLPCLHGCSADPGLKQDADDMCMICFTEALSCAPAIQLNCGHVFHLTCCKSVLMKRWAGPRITFAFSLCPICKSPMEHWVLAELLRPVKDLREDVRRKALMRLEYEGLHKAEAITSPGARFHNDPASYAMDRYAYYVCYKCNKAYYGGEARCDAEVGEEYDPTELVCGACSDVSRAQMCPKHGTDFLEYKCRYCCSVAVFFCFGTTHFCNACHDDFQRVTNIPKLELPSCPAGPKAKQLAGEECPLHVKHPPTGEEFALGCGVCRNAHTF